MVDVVHTPVMKEQVLELLAPPPCGGVYIDATLGEGGHSESLLEAYPEIRVIGVDADEAIIAVAAERLARFGSRFRPIHSWFNAFFSDYPADLPRPDRILFDLGISLFHYERSGRGFSFRNDERLDMRLSDRLETSAYHIVNEYPEEELVRLFFEYGEERYAKRIARAIVSARTVEPIAQSADLAAIIRDAVPAEYRHGRIHPATRTFQSLRIAVNGELVRIEQTLAYALRSLEIGGRMGVITFHSLEDRIVKRFFRLKNSDCTCPPEWPVCRCAGKRVIEIITRRTRRPSEEELAGNPPSRSAKFRVVEKLREEDL
jgi:16S rRNA (cytosine1402-N4)-methyltransferase